MSLEQFLALVRERMSQWAELDVSALRFVDDAEVAYDPPRRVAAPRSALFTDADDQRWRPFLEGSHAWVHANLLTTATGERVVSIRKGQPTRARETEGSPRFAVNVSIEPTTLTIEG